MALSALRIGDNVMHINHSRGETRQFVGRRRNLEYGWSFRSRFNKHSGYNKKHRSQVKAALSRAHRDDSWDNFVCPILREAEDIWGWD